MYSISEIIVIFPGIIKSLTLAFAIYIYPFLLENCYIFVSLYGILDSSTMLELKCVRIIKYVFEENWLSWFFSLCDNRTDAENWKDFIQKPALSYVLRLLTGISQGHPPTQLLIGSECIPVLHKLEQASSDQHIGTMAENLLEALRQNEEVSLKVPVLDHLHSNTGGIIWGEGAFFQLGKTNYVSWQIFAPISSSPSMVEFKIWEFQLIHYPKVVIGLA